MATYPHPFTPDLMGDCQECPEGPDSPTHIQPRMEPAEPTRILSPVTAPNDATIGPDTPLAAIRQYLRERVEDGVQCPACEQRAEVYRRTITGKMAAFLIELSRRPADEPGGWVHIPSMKHSQGDSAKLRFWGLIEGLEGHLRDDGSNRVGYWRITESGRDFAAGRLTVPRHARVYDNRLLGLDPTMGYIGIRDCLGKKFDYDALMSGTA